MADERDGGGAGNWVSAEEAFQKIRAGLTEARKEVAAGRAEIAALRDEVAEVSAELKTVPAAGRGGRDYSTTLGKLEKNVADQAKAITDSPIISMTPRQLGQEVADVVKSVLSVHSGEIRIGAERHEEAERQIKRAFRYKEEQDKEERNLLKHRGWAFLIGFAFYGGCTGPIVRATPDSWHWPEWIAARSLGKSGDEMYFQAGQRQMNAFSSEVWNTQVVGTRIVRENEKALERCARTARDRGPQQCSVTMTKAIATDYLER